MPETYPNTYVILYKGVPLVKNGTEVLFSTGVNAANALSSYIYRSFANCTYTRENATSVRVHAPVADCEGANYLSFQNRSHGGKYFFGFIDKVVYVNENTTQINFTIDPFPTYLSDTVQAPEVFVKRNTPLNDVRGNYLQDDFIPSSAKQEYVSMGQNASVSWIADKAYMYYCVGNNTFPNDMNITTGTTDTGIRVGQATPDKINAIKEDGGVIIGAYLMPSSFYVPSQGFFGWNILRDLGTISGNPLAHVAGYSHSKIKSGVYNSVMLFTSQGAKSYELELFDNVENVVFSILGLMTPGPSVFIYPRNYKGVANNLAEGLYVKFPAIPISTNAVYTTYQSALNDLSVLSGGISGAKSGAAGGPLGALMGSATGMLRPFIRNAFEEYVLTKYKAPSVHGSGDPVVASDFTLSASLVVSSPSALDLNRVSNFFDYYGYNIDAVLKNTALQNQVNTGNGAFLQIGSDMFAGSEADDELNARARAGIKIRTSFS